MKISVIIPVYNIAEYLPRCIESILSQADQEIEVILINDGSTDESATLCDSLVQEDFLKRIRVIHQKNTGPGGARNTGIKAAIGEYIMFVDGDDFILPGTLKNITHALERDKPDVLFGRYLRWVQNRGFIKCKKNGKENFDLKFSPPNDPKLRTEYIIGIFPETSWNSAWRYICKRDLLLRHQLYFNPIMYCEDLKWVLELLDALEGESAKVSFLQEPFYAYNYKRPDSIMNSTSPKRVIDLTAIIAEALPRYKTRPIICKELVWQVFYYINEYCRFDERDRIQIFNGYKKVLPLFRLSGSLLYRLVGKCRYQALFYGLSAVLSGIKYVRWMWKYGVNKRNYTSIQRSGIPTTLRGEHT